MLSRCVQTIAFSLVSVAAGSSFAATMTFTPTITAVLNPDFTPVDPAPVGNHLEPRPGDYYLLQVDVQLSISGQAPGTGFFKSAFDVDVAGDGEAYVDLPLGVLGWVPDNIQFDSNGPAPGGLAERWVVNADLGVDPHDLMEITLEGMARGFGLEAFDIRRTLGQDGNGHTGLFYIKLPGELGSSASATLLTPYPAVFYDTDGNTSSDGHVALGGATSTYTVVPEPATWASLVIAASALIAIRKRR